METSVHLNWLTEDERKEESVVISPTQNRFEYPIPSKIGRAWVEKLEPMPGVWVAHASHRFNASDTQFHSFGMAEAQFPEAVFFAQSILGGTCIHQEHLPKKQLIWGQGKDCFHYGSQYKIEASIETGCDTEMTALFIKHSILVNLLGESIVTHLLANLGLIFPPSANVVAMPPHISAILRGAVSHAYTGRLQELHAQSKVLEYLCALAAFVTHQELYDDISAKQERTLQALHNELISSQGKLPSLAELAVRFGMSPRLLNSAFKMKYGQTIFAYINECRLHESHVALESTSLPIKVLAARLGFSHPNHFISAFKKKFGYPPGHLRRHPESPPKH